MSIGAVGSIVNILREINLNAIKKEAEGRFSIAVVGAEPLASQVAAVLSEEPDHKGVHPWIEVVPLPMPQASGDLSRYDVALLALSTADVDAAGDSALRRLEAERVPAVAVVVNEAAQHQVGADLPRAREVARVVVPPSFDTAAVQGLLIPAMLKTLPTNKQMAFGRQLPRFRTSIARNLIEEASRANAVYALTTGLGEVVPGLNIALGAADILVLTKNQLIMAYKLALLNGKEGSPQSIMGEVLGVIGGGFLFRQVARELVGLIPVVGLLPKVAVSYAGTWLIGRTVQLWASQGQELGTDDLRALYDEAMSRGRSVAERLMERVKRDDDETPALPAPAEDGTQYTLKPAPKRRWWHRIPLIGRLFRRWQK